MGGFIGIDAKRANQDIMDFHREAMNVCASFGDAFHNFFEDLKWKWASKPACEYTTTLLNTANGMFHEFYDEAWSIADGAIDALEILDRQLGGTGINITLDRGENSAKIAEYLDSLGEPCKEVLSGAVGELVGMDVPAVKIILGNFETEMASVLRLLRSLPDSIAFYDQDGELLSTYSGGVQAFINKVDNETKKVSQSMNGYMGSETSNTLFAMEQADQAMKA